MVITTGKTEGFGLQLKISSATLSRSKILLAAATLCWLTVGGALAEGAMTGAVRPFGSVQFATDPDVACLESALETGNPLTGPSTWILKAPPGCVVPWHSHTAEEQLIVVRGS